MTYEDFRAKITRFHPEVQIKLDRLWEGFDELFKGVEISPDWDNILHQVSSDYYWIKIKGEDGTKYSVAFNESTKKWAIEQRKK